ncbi:hypothetical protein NDU88_005758 [Pleurodeles waltl]|uniref:Uncharacterized protein n=1 Tax=Pleurodeles waltl TaxID=8319 RepID=A0AAV7X1N0_PLEWA|nr:hypothetical protein NDU88_005758 [Pleurodeles waltl]
MVQHVTAYTPVSSLGVAPGALASAAGRAGHVAVQGTAANVTGVAVAGTVVQNLGLGMAIGVTFVGGQVQQVLVVNLASASELDMLSAPLVGGALAGIGEGNVLEKLDVWFLTWVVKDGQEVQESAAELRANEGAMAGTPATSPARVGSQALQVAEVPAQPLIQTPVASCAAMSVANLG